MAISRKFHKIWQYCQLTKVETLLIADCLADKAAVVSRKISRHLTLTKWATGALEEIKIVDLLRFCHKPIA